MSNSKYIQDNHLTALSFSTNCDYVVLATKKEHQARVFKVSSLSNIDSWQLIQILKEHTQTISDVNWSKDNKIITASHDRSVVVWKQAGATKWEKMLVNIDIKLSILVAKWAPSCKKFALGSSCSTLALGFYNIHTKCWTVSTRMNFAKAPITSLDFHPSSNLIVVGSADFSFKVISSSFKKSKDPFILDSKVEEYSYEGPFKNVDTLFETILSIDNLGSWINHVSFEESGHYILALPHHNHFKVYEIAEGSKFVVNEEDIRWNKLPFMSGYMNEKKELILGGFDKKVAIFSKKGQKYAFEKFYQINEKSNSIKKKGIVANFTQGIEKKQSFFGEGPNESDHTNCIKMLKVGNTPVSYDINGLIHFWSS